MGDFMNALILAAGYATRLYPLTLDKAKPLLEVAGKPIIEWLADNLANIPQLETIYVVTNDKFASDFQAWADSYKDRQQPNLQIKIINDSSRSDGDNLFNEPLAKFVGAAKNAPATVAVHNVGNPEAMKKYGAVTISANGTVTRFEEKPEKPQSTLAAMALYYYSRDVLPMFTTYLAAGNNPDQPGRFLQWLYTRKPVKAFEIKGHWLDIGSKETLEKAGEIFANL
jgi:glucose-1-phosphate thymidylyltransferase